jgi:ribosomal protein S19
MGAPVLTALPLSRYRGIELDALLDLNQKELVKLFPSRLALFPISKCAVELVRSAARGRRSGGRQGKASVRDFHGAAQAGMWCCISAVVRSLHSPGTVRCFDGSTAVYVQHPEAFLPRSHQEVLGSPEEAPHCQEERACPALHTPLRYFVLHPLQHMAGGAVLSCSMRCQAPMHEKPDVVKTHLRNMIIMPEMIGSVVGVYNGRSYVSVEIKAEMIGTYLAEYSMSYKPVKHGRPGIGATASSKFVPLK